MTTSRLEAFSDGVLAIIITIMVLELKLPHGDHFEDLKGLIPTLISYLLSFIYVGLYWNNHHHLWQIAERVNGKILWANLHLLFWLSLFPFATGWMGEHHDSTAPVAMYGLVLFMASLAWYLLAQQVIRQEGPTSKVALAFNKDYKTKASLLIYASAMAISFFEPRISQVIYALLAALWIIPDKRIERMV
ncbi:putative membrane protein [Dyadobacter jejuensis]|uniref:Putative membrane protein n=1 Tax=Dyadobacter jejuensis TaxID=1082580 RepID=A0A316ART4_9BACT|nr:TMEM175 family protein [Dyadobacter jejuensis]PWJ59954.1 putative membrane protein [Dyadobacter jejuensis]